VKRLDERKTWRAGTVAAMAAVVGLASPAAAADQSTTTLQVSPLTAEAGSPVQLTAKVLCPGEPRGGNGLGVTFFDGGTTLATEPVVANGFASHVAKFTTTGTHTITAAYNGNDNCYASHGMATVTVTPAEDCAWGADPCRDGQGRPPGSPHCPTRTSTLGIDRAARPSESPDSSESPESPDLCRSW